MTESHFFNLFMRLTTLGLLINLTACQLVQLHENKLSNSLANKTDNFLTRHHLSQSSLGSLHIVGQTAEHCLDDPDQCISHIQENKDLENEELYSTASEVYIAKALLIQEKYP